MPKLLVTQGASAPRVFIAVPAYSGAITAECVISLLDGVKALEDAGYPSQVLVETGNCHVDDCRNSMVKQFLETDCELFVFIDEDVGFEALDLVRLVSSPHEVTAGIYPKKQDDDDYPVLVEGSEGDLIDGWLEVVGAPTGFMCIRRHVLESMWEDAKPSAYIGQNGSEYRTIFERMVIDGKRRSGDYAFCQKFRNRGGRIYTDPEMLFTHTGNKTWAGRVGDFWRKKSGQLGPKFIRAMERLKKGEATHEIFCALFDGWNNPAAALPDHLMAAYRLATRKGRIIETGSGLTTLVMACAGAEIHALEANLQWHRKTTDALKQFGLEANVHYTPMKDYGEFVWYEVPEALPESFDIALCDGPERTYGRSGLHRILGSRIKNAEWLVDDCDDPAQLAMLHAYAEGRDIHVLGTDGQRKFALALRQRNDRTANHQPGAASDRGASGRPNTLCC